MENSGHRKVEICHLQDQPLVSVVMPVYNAERYVAETISSILAQTYSHFEFIIVDDGSTDGSGRIVRDFASRDARMRPLSLSHRGQSSALNAGIALAQGEFIAYMDHDDIALPQRLAVQLTWMREMGVDICGGCWKAFGEGDDLGWYPELHEAICVDLVFRTALHHGTSLIRAEIAKANPFNEQVLGGDYELYTRLALRYRLGSVPQVLLRFRRHAQQATQVHQSVMLAELRRFRQLYFYALFPEATAEDYAIVDCIVEKKPFSTLRHLEQAGTWLVRLAQTPDAFLRQRMANRWLAACRRSADLGVGCYRLYQQIAPQFGVAPDQGKLWLECALRLRTESRLYVALASVKRRMKSPRGTSRDKPGKTFLSKSVG